MHSPRSEQAWSRQGLKLLIVTRKSYTLLSGRGDWFPQMQRCRDKGVGDDPCVLKRDCPICKAFTPEQILQLATPTYRERKNKEKKVSASPTPTIVDPSQVSVLGWVDGEKTVKKSETPAGKKKRMDDSPEPSSNKAKSSSKPGSDEEVTRMF